MTTLELNTRKVVRRLEAEGWANQGGGEHDVFRHTEKPGVIIVPRHRTLSAGVARQIRRLAGW
ncbi:MAG: type II toxin-antitoxin system HicA family toxin [Caulobacteraceae bacterium]|nr:type II toxin-antitoxin system HicA family toxin [Caulobacter sp.]